MSLSNVMTVLMLPGIADVKHYHEIVTEYETWEVYDSNEVYCGDVDFLYRKR